MHEGSYAAMIAIRASIPFVYSVLQAKAETLLVAARIASLLNLQHHTFGFLRRLRLWSWQLFNRFLGKLEGTWLNITF
jgi:hypothetical protein